MKSNILNVRIPEEIKNTLLKKSEELGINLSDMIREILTTHCDENENNDLSSVFNIELYNSNEFIFLLTWLIDKRKFPSDNNEIEVLIDLKNITLKVIKDQNFPEYLRSEFEKVHFDLSKFIKNFGSIDNRFEFCDLYNSDCFDYFGLIEYINLRSFENRI